MIAHVIYFETLASINDETSPAWKSTVAGLVVLRLIDDWLDTGAQIVTTDVTGLRAIRNTIAAVSEGDPIRSILSNTVDTLERAEVASIRAIATNLMAYGRALHYVGQWDLARDVFETLIRRAQDAEDSDTLIYAALRLGFVNRRTGMHEESEAAYMLAEEEALRVGNREGQARARLGIAQNAVERGLLDKAEEYLEEAINLAHTHALNAVLADALHERAHLSHSRRDFAAAVRHGYSALEFAQDGLVRDHILGNLAASFAELGNLAAARDAHLIVLATVQEEWLRQQTLINLMDIAILEHQETGFHHYRRILADSTFQPLMKGYFHVYSGRGYRVFGDLQRASNEFQKAAELGTQHSLHNIEQMAAEEIQKTDVPQKTASSIYEWSDEIKEIASAIGHLRELTEAGQKLGVAG